MLDFFLCDNLSKQMSWVLLCNLQVWKYDCHVTSKLHIFELKSVLLQTHPPPCLPTMYTEMKGKQVMQFDVQSLQGLDNHDKHNA